MDSGIHVLGRRIFVSFDFFFIKGSFSASIFLLYEAELSMELVEIVKDCKNLLTVSFPLANRKPRLTVITQRQNDKHEQMAASCHHHGNLRLF